MRLSSYGVLISYVELISYINKSYTTMYYVIELSSYIIK